jgi:large subunit ribosomal protein L15
MDLSNLKPAKGSTGKKRRLGRGQGSGKGGTATKGHKGQKSRSGYSRKIGFEGGQMPLQRRIPKYGFKNINRKEYKGINLSTLEELATQKKLKSMDIQTFIDAGLVNRNSLVKILGNGKLTQKLEVKAHAFSKAAQEAIESNEGKAVKI